MITTQQAINAVFALLRETWLAIDSNYGIKWPDKASASGAEPGQNGKPWIRVSVMHKDGSPASLPGANGTKIWTREATLQIEVFTKAGQGVDYSLVANFERAFARASIGVSFTSLRKREIGENGDWFQVNLLCDFNYDEVI